MVIDFNKSQTFYRYSKTLNKSELCTHLYMPWSDEIDPEFLFKVKHQLKNNGHTFLPLLDLSGEPMVILDNEVEEINSQCEKGHLETHLVMNNQNVIHVLKVEGIFSSEEIDTFPDSSYLQDKKDRFETWVKVSDLYVLDVNYLGVKEDITKKLVHFLQSEQERPLFQKWIKMDRQLTYDYFMRSCELEESIYQGCWDSISKKAQHLLIHGENLRKESVSIRNIQKWENLSESFLSYRDAVMWELNETYVLPLVDTISRYDSCLREWKQFCEKQTTGHESLEIINSLIENNSDGIESFEEFFTFMNQIKAHLFTFKNKFTSTLFSEEFLILEKCLNNHEQKVEAFKYQDLSEKVLMIDKIDRWVNEINRDVVSMEATLIKNCNLKLTHLLSLMNSSSDQNNILFSLLEAKLEKGCSGLSLVDEVKTLFTERVGREVA